MTCGMNMGVDDFEHEFVSQFHTVEELASSAWQG